MRCISPARAWLAVDIVLYIIVLVVTLLLGSSTIHMLPGAVSCSDPGLQHPLNSDTISLELVLITCFPLPSLVILVVELLAPCAGGSGCAAESDSETGSASCAASWRSAVWRTLPLIWDIVVGELIAYLLLEVLKCCTAEPRPHFWNSCGMDYKSTICAGKAYAEVDLGNCSNPHKLSWRHLADASKSFPSGHACFSTFVAVFMTAYHHHRLSTRASDPPHSCRSVLRKWLSLPWLVWACVVSTSRLWDNRHHWWDVLAGAALGAGMAAFTVTTISKSFRSLRRSTSRRRTDSEEMEYLPIGTNCTAARVNTST